MLNPLLGKAKCNIVENLKCLVFESGNFYSSQMKFEFTCTNFEVVVHSIHVCFIPFLTAYGFGLVIQFF